MNTDQAYNEGHRAAWVQMMRECVKQLGIDHPKVAQNQWIIERVEAVAALRQLCAEVGDNDWNAKLRLSDVIENHLAQHLVERD